MPTVLVSAALVAAYAVLDRGARVQARRQAAAAARAARRARHRELVPTVRRIAGPDLRLLVAVPATAETIVYDGVTGLDGAVL
jgi:small-conductance mechanosensitive channel